MELRHLRTALAVLRHGTVNHTAAALDVAPSSVSDRVRELETELGTPLFHRTRQGMTATAAGGAYLAAVDRALRSLDEAADRLTAAVPARVGALRSIADTLLPPFLDRLAERHPEVEVVLRAEVDRAVLLRSLRDGDLDVVLLLDTGDLPGGLGFPVPPGTWAFVDLREVPLRAVCGPEHPLRDRPVDVATLRAAGDLIGQQDRCSYWLATRNWLGPQATLTAVGSLVQVKEWVAAGRGVAVLPDFVVDADVAAGRLATLDLPVPPLRLRMIRRDDEAPSAGHRRFVYALSQL